MTNASLGLNDIQRIDDDDVEEEENYGRCESPVLSKIFHRSQRSIKEMTPDDPELVEAARKAVIPLPATPQPLTGHDLEATVPVDQSAVNPSFSLETNLMPSTAKIPESLCDLLNFENTSWTSSLATPHGRNVTYSNLNTEEKKVLVSNNPVPRSLFTPEVKEEKSQKSLNESFMECSGILPSVAPKKLCKAYEEFSTSDIFSSNDASQNTTVLTGIEKYSDVSLGCSTSAKEPHLVREVLDLLVSPVTTSRQKTYSKAESLSETPLHRSNYKYVHEFGKVCKLRPKAKRLFRKGNEPCSDRESDTTINGDQINNDIDGPTVNISKEQPVSPNLSGTFIFASPISPVLKAKADEKQHKSGVLSCSPVLHRTQEFLHDFSFSTLEEVCQASEVLASGCTSPVENCEISNNFLAQNIESCRTQNVSPIQFQDIACHSSRLVVHKTSTPIHTERSKKACANKKKIKFLNIHQGQKLASSVKEHKEKLDFLCKPEVASQKSDVVEQNSKYDNDLIQHSNTSINKNNFVGLNNFTPDSTESLRHRVVSVKSNAKQKNKFAYISELGTCNTVNITRFPSVDTILNNMLQSAEALEAVSLLQNENFSSSLKKHLEEMCRTETDFVPFNKLSLVSTGQQSIAGNFVKKINVSEEESKNNLDNALHKTMGDHTITSGRKRKSGSNGIPRDQCLPKRTCKELKSVQVPEVFKRPDSNNLQSYVSDTQMNVVFDNVDAIVAEFNSKVDIRRTVVGSCNTSYLSNFHTENKCPTSLLENINAFPSENYVNKDDIRTEGNNLSSRKNRTGFCNMDKNEIDQLENPIELKTQNNYSLKHKLPDSETRCDSSRNVDNKFRKELDASDNISLDIGSTKMVNITQQFEGKQIIPKECEFSCHEIKECVSEEPVSEEYNETSFLNSHQHIFDSSFTAVTQKATELVVKEHTKEEGLLGCEQSNTVECNITDETKAESSHVRGSAQNILEDINEDSADKDVAAEHTPYTEFNKKESSHLCNDSESSNISENESSKQQSHMTNMRQVFQKKYDSIISPPICKSRSHSSKIKMNGNPVSEDFAESCKSLVFNHDKLYEIIHYSDKCLQAQPNVVVSSADNAEKELCAQGNILGVQVSEGTDPGMFFTTAKGKKIEMSKRCLDLACNLFSDIIEPNIEQFDGQGVCTTQEKGVTNTVTINEGDLTKNNDTKNCKENYDKNDNSDVQYSRMESLNLINMTTTDAVPLPVGFSTASGKTLTFSEKSLHKARHILQSVIDLETSRDNTLHDFNLSSMRDTDTPSLSNTNLQRCTALPENAMPLPKQFFQNKVANVADASSNGKTLQLARMPESVRVSQTKLSGHRDTCVTAESHSSTLQKQLDETKKLSVKFKTNNSTDNMDNDEQKQRNILAQEIKSNESLLKIDSATADKIEMDVKSRKVESGFTTAAGGRLFILGKGLHKAKKIFSDILSKHPTESKDCNTGRGSSAESASEGNHEPDNSMSTDKGPLPKTSSYKTVQAMLDIEGSNYLLNSEYETLCAADLLTGSCTLTESVLEDTKTKFESTFVTPAESDTTSPQKLIGLEDTCHSNQTEIANTEICKGLNSESNLNRGFMTAAGKNIIVSTASLDRAKRLMSDISVMNEDDCKNIVSQVKRKDLKDSQMPQQKDKHNMLEKEQIKKVNTVLLAEHMEEWKTHTMGHNLTESLNKLTTPETVEPTDLKAKKCPENISAVPQQVVNSQFSCGFQTAAGKPLEISLASLSKVEQMFDDIMIPVIKEHDCTVTSQLKKSLQNAENISTTFERNVNVHDKFMKTLDTINVIERKPGTHSSPEKNDTFSFVTADGRDVEISQLSFQEVKETNEIRTGEMCSPKKIYGTSLDKVKKTLFNKTTLIEQTCNIESGSEIKTLNKKENSAHTKISPMGGGFITAGGKSVGVSEESLMRVRNLFSDITENFEESTLTEGNMKEKEAIQGSSSNGKKVIPHGKMKNSSQDRAIEMKKILSTESKNEVQICHQKNSMGCKRVNVCGGFLTAGGKKVDVSEESLLKVQNLFSDITETVEKPTMTAGNMMGKDPTEMDTRKRREIISPEKVKNLSSDKTVEMEKVSNTTLIEQTCNNESGSEIKTLNKKENSAHTKISQMCGGFLTAGGKSVGVSEESLMRVRNLFSDINENFEETTLTEGNMKEKEAIEGSSSNGKKVIPHGKMKISSQDRAIEMKKIFSTESENEVQICHNNKKSMDCKRVNVCGGFVTAGGKKVDVSEESLLKVRNLFSDITETVEKPTMTAGNMKRKDPTEMYTCKRREIISPEKVKNLSSDRTVEMEKVSNTESENEVQILDKKENSVNCQRRNMSFGFTTAGGKKINVSEESLARVKNLFSDTTENSENNTLNVENMKLKEVPEVYSSKKKDIISVETVCSLPPNRSTRTRKMSDGEFQNEVKLLEKKENSVNCGRLNMCGGFVTAGGRNVGVSEASLARVRDLFSDITENVEETTFNLRNVKEKEAIVMNCLNNKDILPLEKVKSSSSGARKIAETEFENEVNLLDKEENSISCKKLNTFGGFVTAGGKKMEVSEESLATVRKLFSDITENVEENTLSAENTKENEAAEWQCLKKKDVLALETVEKPLSDRTIGNQKISGSESENEVKLVDKKQNVVESKRRKIYGGFVTGCGKKVEVSEESLAKVRSIFSDMTGSEENSPVVVRNVDSSPSYVKKTCIAATDCELNEFSLGTETHRYTPYQESAAKRSKETSISVLDMKNYVSGTTASNKPYGNALVENVLRHNTKINATTNQRVQKNEPTLTQEVSESTAALLLDDDFKKELEESDSSCFSMLTERSCSPDLSVTMGSATSIDREPGSPVIGSKNKCSRSNKVLVRRNTTAKKAERITALAKNACDQSTFEDKNNTSSIPEGNGRRKRCNCIQDNQMHKKQCMSNVGLNENVGEPPAAKMKAHVIPSPGSWLQLRISAQKPCVQWRDISDGNPPSQFSELELLQFGMKKSVINVTSKTAEYFKFSASDFYRDGNCPSLQGGDDTSLEFDADGFAGVQEVEQAFLTSPNVDKSLIPAGWIQNHYRWIVWKLAATERSFPPIFASRYLTPRVLLLQLKYRYDREIDRCQRPALRRILEHDDAPGKRMVLCVADIIKQEETQEENVKEGSRQSLKMCNYELELTDSWYSIRSTVDKEMCHLIEAGRVVVGTKLITHSAELVNCEQPCPPLEAGPNVRLKIHTNSTRRARWDCRLGYCRQPGPLPVSLSSLKPAGGVISCVAAVIARVYPIVYMEKGSDGKAEFYSAKQEALRASKRERQWQEHIEKLYSQERGQLSQFEWFSACSQQSKPKGTSKKHVTTPTRQQLAAATCVEDLWQLLCNAPDPTSLQSLLTEEQRDAVANYQQMRQQQLLQELEARVRKRIEEERNGTSSLALLKVRCLDAKDCSARSAVLSIWRPSEDLLTLFQEGSVLKLFSITANGLRNGDLQLSACRQSRYQPQPCQPPNDFPARCVTPLSHVSSGNLQASFGELDCVGVVVHVAPPSGNYQTVYLADADMDIVGISFWNGLKASGWEDILKQKALVACSNLQSRVGAAVHWIPTTYATEFSVFSQHPRQKHLVEALESLRRNLNMDIENFSYTCEGIVLSFLNEQIVTPVRNASLNVRHTKPSTSELSRLNTPGVTPELSEKVQRRLFKLEKYGEPPSLSPLALIPRSRVLKKSFHVPLKTVETADSSCDDSPPMSLDSDDT